MTLDGGVNDNDDDDNEDDDADDDECDDDDAGDDWRCGGCGPLHPRIEPLLSCRLRLSRAGQLHAAACVSDSTSCDLVCGLVRCDLVWCYAALRRACHTHRACDLAFRLPLCSDEY